MGESAGSSSSWAAISSSNIGFQVFLLSRVMFKLMCFSPFKI